MLWAIIPNKVKAFLAAAGAILVAVFVAFMKGRKSGVTSAKAEAQKENQRVEEKFRKIDSAPADFDSAVSDLRKRASARAFK